MDHSPASLHHSPLIVDVAIVGGGPAGSTAGSMLKKYRPDLSVLILEREKFPRDHVGESQLPPIGAVLDEIGVWDKVEAANFPIKIGATYRWGTTQDLWDFEFLPGESFKEERRPGKYRGQRTRTAFQVDRSVYDKVLLDHAAEMGCDVREETRVVKVGQDAGTITGLELEDGQRVEARYYLDASGTSGLLRRALGVEMDQPSSLRNIAIWDYWQNAEWAVNIGVGGTRVQVLSIGYGWLWFIPLGPTRTSIGLVCPADYPKNSGLKPEEVYLKAVQDEPLVRFLTAKAEREGPIHATKDWSQVALQMAGPNWFLIGESAGFADPILAAGMTMAHIGARECAYTILELERGEHDAAWLREQFSVRQTRRIRQHISFADFWYSANAHFTDLQEWTAEIAKESGIVLDRQKAWQWMGQGGFIGEESFSAGFGGYRLSSVKTIHTLLSGLPTDWSIEQFNVFDLDMEGASVQPIARYDKGRISAIDALARGNKILPLTGYFGPVVDVLHRRRDAPGILAELRRGHRERQIASDLNEFLGGCVEALEAMVLAGWVKGSYSGKYPMIRMELLGHTQSIHANRDNRQPDPVEAAGA